MAFDLQGIKSFTRFWALLMFGSYSVINIIVLLNMLIAMMSNSYQIISEKSDSEWKFARSHLWISYFDSGHVLPPPFNLFPTVKIIYNMMASSKRTTKSIIVSICINRDLICCGKFYITSSIGFMFFLIKEKIFIFMYGLKYII